MIKIFSRVNITIIKSLKNCAIMFPNFQQNEKKNEIWFEIFALNYSRIFFPMQAQVENFEV